MAAVIQHKSTKRQTSAKTKSKVPLLKGDAKPAKLAGVVSLRNQLQLNQATFARLLPVSVRSLATLESGSPPTAVVARRLTELQRLTNALMEVIKKDSIGRWLQTPNESFGGLKPVEVIDRGESDRLWSMIYFLRSGVPS